MTRRTVPFMTALLSISALAVVLSLFAGCSGGGSRLYSSTAVPVTQGQMTGIGEILLAPLP